MTVALITGSAGLVGSEAVGFFAGLGMDVVGIDNDLRSLFFGPDASTHWQLQRLQSTLGTRYTHFAEDIRNLLAVERVFKRYAGQIGLVIHAAAQPSHDWAAKDPQTDFSINANGTLNLLEATRRYAPNAPFIYTSTNKVYGDSPNRLPLVEQANRWEIDPSHPYSVGIDESMSIDQSLHSVFGASKAAADLLVQEYGRYFGLQSACFRGGCLTGPNHSGTMLHGFLAYLMKCAASGAPYNVFGYQGKQVRDNIHSADLIQAFYQFFLHPRGGEVYNMGGGRGSNCSMLEAIALCEEITNRPVNWTYVAKNRIGDHVWYISNLAKFKSHFPDWKTRYDVPSILREIYDVNRERWAA